MALAEWLIDKSAYIRLPLGHATDPDEPLPSAVDFRFSACLLLDRPRYSGAPAPVSDDDDPP